MEAELLSSAVINSCQVFPDNNVWNARNNGTSWQAGLGAIFDLGSNLLRPEGWTSADAPSCLYDRRR